VDDVSIFQQWINDTGTAFTQTAPGEPGGIMIYAWSGTKPWLLIGEARVLSSGPSGRADQPHLIMTERPKLYPVPVAWVPGTLFRDIGQVEYEAIQRKAFRGRRGSTLADPLGRTTTP
jgi:hypothetical protein